MHRTLTGTPISRPDHPRARNIAGPTLPHTTHIHTHAPPAHALTQSDDEGRPVVRLEEHGVHGLVEGDPPVGLLQARVHHHSGEAEPAAEEHGRGGDHPMGPGRAYEPRKDREGGGGGYEVGQQEQIDDAVALRG